MTGPTLSALIFALGGFCVWSILAMLAMGFAGARPDYYRLFLWLLILTLCPAALAAMLELLAQ